MPNLNKKYVGKKFECVGGKILDRNGTQRFDTTTRLFESMLLSDAFTTLTPKQQILYVYCKAQFYGKRKPRDDYGKMGLFQGEEYFYLSLQMVKAYGLYTDSTHANFYRDMTALEKHGLIKKVSAGQYKKKSVYQYSGDWKTWTENKNVCST